MPSKLAVSIVNYRTADLVIDCLRSLAGEIEPAHTRVIVADNASNDGSVEKIRDAIDAHGYSGWASVLALPRNGGFAYGNNAAIRPLLGSADRPDYVLLLNPDTVVRPGAIHALVEFMQKHPDAGIVGSRLEYSSGRPQHSAFRFHTILSELDRGLRLRPVSRLLSKWVLVPPLPESAWETDWVSGASMMVRTKVFESIGLLDEGYFLYYEEVDLCLRAARADWTCWYEPRSRVVHLIGQASGVDDFKESDRRLPSCLFESRRRYFLKNHGRLYAVLADTLWTLGYLLWRMRRAVQRRPDRDPPKLLRDFIRNSVFVRGFHL